MKISNYVLTEAEIRNIGRKPKKPEQQTEDELLDVISDFFVIAEKVKCKHFSSSRAKVIDFVIRPKRPWCRGDLIFGVEVKRKDRDSLQEYTKQFGQSCDYANSYFDLRHLGDDFFGYCGYLPILTFPTFSPHWVSIETLSVIRRMASRVGVGEMGWFRNEEPINERQTRVVSGFGIVWQGHPLWYSHLGTTMEGADWPIKRKFGSR